MENYRIALYADTGASTTSLKEEFQRALGKLAGQIDIVEVTAQDIRAGRMLDDRTMVFVMPGIIGENSPYPAQLGDTGNAAIRNYVTQGGVFMGLCAGGYYGADKIEYVPDWGPVKSRTTGILSLFNGLARGPVPGLGTAAAAPGAYNGCSTAPFALADGRRGEMAYSCGPAFYDLPANAKVLARYDTAEKPVAAFTAPYGGGHIILSGILPQYGVPDGWCPSVAANPLDALLTRLQPHEALRRQLWGQMVNIIAKRGPSP